MVMQHLKEFRKQKNMLCTGEASMCFTSKNQTGLIIFIIKKLFFE